MTRVLDGSELAGFIKERQLHQVRGLRQHFRVVPRLAILKTQDDPVINLYVRLKKRYAEDVGIDVDDIMISQSKLADKIKQLNTDEAIKGMIVQLPITDTSETDELVNLIDSAKDVDGMGERATLDPATAMAINWLLVGYNVDLAHKKIALVGRGRLVGKPLARMWSNSGYNVSIYGRDTQDLKTELLKADVVVTATGQPGLIKPDMLRDGAVVVDAGTASEHGKVVGDLDPAVRERGDLTLTPEKGGVGPLTIAALMDNVIRTSLPVNAQ